MEGRKCNAYVLFPHFVNSLNQRVFPSADMNKTVDRHLLEQKWRKDGDLDLLVSI